MSLKGIVGRIALIDLSTGNVTIEQPDDTIYLDYLGGYGLGAYYIYQRQPARVDPLGAKSILGLIAGPLTGTDAITGNRFTVVGKSPKTGGWGDANCGGRFGPALKQAGLDAVFLTGRSDKPVYVLVQDGRVSVEDARPYWGLLCAETEARLKERYGGKAQAAVIGPAGEAMSALAAIINDDGRAAGRSGLGMVMGAKHLKAVVAIASQAVEVADERGLKDLRQQVLKEHYHPNNPAFEFFRNYGTPGVLEPNVKSGDAPILNWRGTAKDIPGCDRIGGNAVRALKSGSYGCWRCPLACGGKVLVPEGPYTGEGHKPEYETLGAFGTMCGNTNLESICRLNNICNDYGMDTISAGATVAFAIECFENGVITSEDLDGLQLTWGNHEAIVRITEQMARGEGFAGKILSDGIKKAVERLGAAASPYAMECGGEELPMHDPRCFPGLAASYVADATPGRHTQYGSWTAEGNSASPGSRHPAIPDKYRFQGKGETHKYLSCYGHVMNAAGLCMFGTMVTPEDVMPKYLSLAMGPSFNMEKVLEIGERIANLRIAFNLREGVRNLRDYKLPGRVVGQPPLEDGRTRGVSVDNSIQIRDYCMAMGWNPETGVPEKAVFERLGLEFARDAIEA